MATLIIWVLFYFLLSQDSDEDDSIFCIRKTMIYNDCNKNQIWDALGERTKGGNDEMLGINMNRKNAKRAA